MKKEKPPIGLMPHHLWVEERISNLVLTIERYKKEGIQPKIEWISEVLLLQQWLMNYTTPVTDEPPQTPHT